MLRWFIHRKLREFEKATGYDAAYMHDVLDTDFDAFMAFSRATKIGEHRAHVPIDVYTAVSLTAGVAADCGPCAQLGITKALGAGVRAATIASILRGELDALDEPVRQGVRFARGVVTRDATIADPARAALEQRFGRKAVITLGLALCAAQLYPTFKWAVGEGHACQRLDVDGVTIVPHLAAAAHV